MKDIDVIKKFANGDHQMWDDDMNDLLIEYIANDAVHNKLIEKIEAETLIARWETDLDKKEKSIKRCEVMIEEVNTITLFRKKVIKKFRGILNEMKNG